MQAWRQGAWNQRPEWLSPGQAMLNMADAIGAGERQNMDTSKWKAFLRKSADFHARRMLSPDWQPESSTKAFFLLRP
ncbi:MAG: hypothetical protein U5R06_11910 [candidate division KSB1 bacterium]|nr:hypothetical protein [candidate division KSB1 bacterium]